MSSQTRRVGRTKWCAMETRVIARFRHRLESVRRFVSSSRSRQLRALSKRCNGVRAAYAEALRVQARPEEEGPRERHGLGGTRRQSKTSGSSRRPPNFALKRTRRSASSRFACIPANGRPLRRRSTGWSGSVAGFENAKSRWCHYLQPPVGPFAGAGGSLTSRMDGRCQASASVPLLRCSAGRPPRQQAIRGD